ncbi:MAG TPA: sigma-54 dependent transcriptional regulator [Flexilinea sp.]|jgi:DNA-binding NtrC family response regulator|nr:sigma-54-dependent Fis family transcriptional regulator [Flexilinea sp.]HOG21561.1 sigma-54 dependent transcriptional regulator [Flexilinea sp.]HOP00692.1 sigma-54 dependent transcriptional regulator [Flexilinea sp.]HOU18494.1 sigma-54 dependent transcriptional regulator [Flexilinea sp.]HPB39825.1 sigma-54 dependent transcriptional regulator [Flexilinea sp.]
MDFTVLVVDDEENFREGIKQYLSRDVNYEILDAASLSEAREILNRQPVDIIMLDVQVGKEYGPDLLYDINRIRPTPKTILITAYGEVEMAVDAMKNGAFDFLSKPVSFPLLEATLKRAEDVIRLQKEIESLMGAYKKDFSFVVGQNEKMKRIFKDAQLAAKAQVSILIGGETGTGKEVLAKFIHQNGPRANKLLVPINCAAIQPTILESELFGYEAGAFTNAEKRKPGLFEVADGGILFLDEISSMSMDMQSKLLRAIEEKKVRHVGGTKEIPVDVQIVAASNRNIPEMIEKGDFREDLYYRLRIVDIEIPPLRERKEDLPELIGFFVKSISAERGVNITKVSEPVLRAFQNYSWPGNIRELKNAIERASIFCEGDTINLCDIPADIAKFE